MKKTETIIFAERELYGRGVRISMVTEGGKTMQCAAPVVMQECDPAAIVDPFLRLRTEEAQRLMDELWQCGLRPSEGSGSAGSLAATERHLKDMKTIAFHALKIPT